MSTGTPKSALADASTRVALTTITGHHLTVNASAREKPPLIAAPSRPSTKTAAAAETALRFLAPPNNSSTQ